MNNSKKYFMIYTTGIVISAIIFFVFPNQLDIATKVVFYISSNLGITVPALITMQMQVKQTNKLKRDIEKMEKEDHKEKIKNFVGLVKLEKYIHGDLKRIGDRSAINGASLHSLYRELRSWKDNSSAHKTPMELVADRIFEDYNGLLELLEELDPHVQKVVLSYVYFACKEYENKLGKLGASAEKDDEVMRQLKSKIHKGWMELSVGFDKQINEIKDQSFSNFRL